MVDNEIFLPYWRDAAYLIGNKGTIKGKNGKILTPHPNRSDHGYLKVDLYLNKHRVTKYVHRLVAEAHLNGNSPILPGFEVNHKDKNRNNNTTDNLEIITAEKNAFHRWNGVHDGKNLPF